MTDWGPQTRSVEDDQMIAYNRQLKNKGLLDNTDPNITDNISNGSSTSNMMNDSLAYKDPSVLDQASKATQTAILTRLATEKVAAQGAANPVEAMSESEKANVKKKMDDPSDQDAADAAKQTTVNTIQSLLSGQESKPQSMSDAFLGALAYFGPTIGAGLIGSAIGGSEAGVASAKAATDLNKGWMDFQQKAQKDNDPYKRINAIIAAKNADTAAASLVVRKDIGTKREERLSDTQSFKEKNYAGELDVKKRRVAAIEKRNDIQKLKIGSLSDKQASEVGSTVESIKDVNDVIETWKSHPKLKNEVGPLGKGMFSGSIGSYLGTNSPEYTKLMGDLKEMKSEIFHRKFGTAISKQEMELLQKDYLPTESTPPKKFIEMMENFRERLTDKLHSNLSTIGILQPQKKETVDAAMGRLNDVHSPKKPTKEQLAAEMKKRGL